MNALCLCTAWRTQWLLLQTCLLFVYRIHCFWYSECLVLVNWIIVPSTQCLFTETCGLCLTHKYSISVPFHWSVWQRTEQFSVPNAVGLEYRSIKCHRNCLWQLPIHFNWSLLVSQLADNHSISNILCFLCRMYVWKYMVMVDNGTSCYIRNCLFLMHHRYSMKRQLPLVCPKDNALNSSLYPTLSVWNTGQSSATETAFDNYRSTSMGRF